MKAVTYLVLHHTDTPEGIPVLPEQIINNELLPRSPYKNRPRFDVLIGLDGTLHTLANEHNPSEVDLWGISQGPHGVLGTFRHIAFVGGRTRSSKNRKDTRTKEQTATLGAIVKYYVKRFPDVIVTGIGAFPNSHGVFNPAFDVNQWLDELEIPKKNQYKK